jgi:hypothetical protein
VKKLVSFRFDPDLLDKARRSAEAENRSLTNFVETVLKRSIDPDDRDDPGRTQPVGGDA